MLNFPNTTPIVPFREIVAYEALWNDRTTSFKSLANLFAKHPGCRPSDFVKDHLIEELYPTIKNMLLSPGQHYQTNLLINGTFDYPKRLKDAREPIELLYYSGNLSFLHTRCIAIVGTRRPSEGSLVVATQLTTQLVKDDFTIVSGLATGIDTQAHTAALAAGGRTIAVIGTPLNKVYPRENADLQDTIAKDHLLISQVPFFRYSQQGPDGNRLFFPERNKTMSALTEATLIIEAGETSGTLIQAKAALEQNRKLLIWDNCFLNKEIVWPQRFLEKGAIRVRSYDDIQKALTLSDASSPKN
jgi:DNA processing protein